MQPNIEYYICDTGMSITYVGYKHSSQRLRLMLVAYRLFKKDLSILFLCKHKGHCQPFESHRQYMFRYPKQC